MTLLCQFFSTFAPQLPHTFCFLKKCFYYSFYFKKSYNSGVKNGKAQRKSFKWFNISLLTLWFYYRSSPFKFYLNSYLYIVRYTYRKTLHNPIPCVSLPDLVQPSSPTIAVITILTLFSSLPLSKLLPIFNRSWYCKSLAIKSVYNKHSYSF